MIHFCWIRYTSQDLVAAHLVNLEISLEISILIQFDAPRGIINNTMVTIIVSKKVHV